MRSSGTEFSISIVKNAPFSSVSGSHDLHSVVIKNYGSLDAEFSSSTSPTRYGVTDVKLDSAYSTLKPALPSTVQLSLTIVYIVVFSLIFVLVYVQLWMIWYYRHKRLSHQTLFLFMCLVWAGLRTSLFSFYFQNCKQANNLNVAFYWLLYSLPVCLQFSMLCLLLHFFAQVVLKARAKYEPMQYKCPLQLFIGASVLLFISVNIACAVVTKQHEVIFASVPLKLIYVRVVLTEAMFLIYGILLSISIYKMTKMATTQRVLEAKGTTVRQAVVATILITLLFLSRTVYNLISICPAMDATPNFGFDWINVTDQADAVSKLSESMAYVSFGLVLFVWEVLPISIVVIFFRVKRLSMGQVLTDFSTHSSGSRVFFFDNPRRYDSENDLISQQNSGYLHAGRSCSFSGDSYPSQTSRGTPIGSSLLDNVSESASQTSSPTLASSLPNSSLLSYSRGNSYGAINGDGFVQSGLEHVVADK